MDASVNHISWFLRISEQTLRAFAMGLVLTGQMLPAGAVSAQDDPPSPSFASPPAKPKSGLTPVAVESPQGEAEENSVEPQSDEALPPAVEGEAPSVEEMPAAEEAPAEEAPVEEAPVEVPLADEPPAVEPTPTTEEVPTPAEAHPEPAAAPASPAKDAAPALDATTEQAPAPTQPAEHSSEPAPLAAPVEMADLSKHQIGEWTMTIMPGPVPPKVVHESRASAGCEAAPMNQNNISVPVNVTVNNTGSQGQGWPWASPWATPWSNLNYWNSPTAAYLFQHPQPYWQLRQDFYHLKPFIRGL